MNIIQKILLMTLFFGLLYINTNAQDACRAKERLDEVKKVKLLKVLNLSDEEADKFLVKYTSLNKVVTQNKKNMDDAIDELQKSIKSKAADDEISQKTQTYLNSLSAFRKSVDDRNAEIKTVLNPSNYAKYLVFENKFRKELQKAVMKKCKKEKSSKHKD